MTLQKLWNSVFITSLTPALSNQKCHVIDPGGPRWDQTGCNGQKKIKKYAHSGRQSSSRELHILTEFQFRNLLFKWPQIGSVSGRDCFLNRKCCARVKGTWLLLSTLIEASRSTLLTQLSILDPAQQLLVKICKVFVTSPQKPPISQEGSC